MSFPRASSPIRLQAQGGFWLPGNVCALWMDDQTWGKMWKWWLTPSPYSIHTPWKLWARGSPGQSCSLRICQAIIKHSGPRPWCPRFWFRSCGKSPGICVTTFPGGSFCCIAMCRSYWLASLGHFSPGCLMTTPPNSSRNPLPSNISLLFYLGHSGGLSNS
jgi:hypothetical protein